MVEFLIEVSELTMRLYAKLAGIRVQELAKAVAARDASRVRANAEKARAHQLDRIVKRLRPYRPEELESDIKNFARAEVEEEDPLQARRIVPEDAFGVGAAFGHSLERRSP
jgi:hypothetical protein